MSSSTSPQFQTPYELGNGNQTTTWRECIAFYDQLAQRFPRIFRLEQIGNSDAGIPIHLGIVSADGIFDREQIKRESRPVFFNNNGIHPGEPEGIDACMAIVRDFCIDPQRLAALGKTVFLFIPIYNVDGCHNRGNTSRVNQDGPEQFGFRGNSRHLDLNRDFIKCDSLNAQIFNQTFSAWDPDVMVDTHTSNGADYQHTMTLIPTQPDKLDSDDVGLASFMRETMLPRIYADMEIRGWPTCPYVNPVKEIPDDGIEDFLEVPRFSTGYAALHHTIGFMPETHMLKPFADRYLAMRSLVEVVLAFTVEYAAQIQALRAAARFAGRQKGQWPIHWVADHSRPSTFRFKGYQAQYSPSRIGKYTRLSYDRQQPWEKEIPYFNRFVPDVVVARPVAYVIPQEWWEVIDRLQWNDVDVQRIVGKILKARVSYIRSVQSRHGAYEGHLFHDHLEVETKVEEVKLRTGDVWVALDQDSARYAVETLEPLAHDSFFRWGFFNSILEKKETYSDYVFEDVAEQLLKDEPELQQQFAQWSAAHPELLTDQKAVLDFIFEHASRYREPEWRRYPVIAVFA